MLFLLITTTKEKGKIPEPLRVNKEEPSNFTRQTRNKISSPNSIPNTSDATTKDLLSQTPTTLKWIPCHTNAKPLRMALYSSAWFLIIFKNKIKIKSLLTTTSIIIQKCKNLPRTCTEIYEKGSNFNSKTIQKWMLWIKNRANLKKKFVHIKNNVWGSTSLAWSDRQETICWRSWRPTPPQPIRIKGIFFIFLLLLVSVSIWFCSLSLSLCAPLQLIHTLPLWSDGMSQSQVTLSFYGKKIK